MKSLGIVRQIDELGRIVLPKEIRRTFELNYKDPIEIYVDNDKIILKKFSSIIACVFCGKADKVIHFNNKVVCSQCCKSLAATSIQIQREEQPI